MDTNFNLQMLCGRPCTLINGICIFEGALIVTQFWMLVLTTDWQHIVTLVLLMFANYLLLAKLFKDKVSSTILVLSKSFLNDRVRRQPMDVCYRGFSDIKNGHPKWKTIFAVSFCSLFAPLSFFFVKKLSKGR